MAAGKRKKKVETVFLVCEETGDHNYTLKRKQGGEKLKLKKFRLLSAELRPALGRAADDGPQYSLLHEDGLKLE